jgi:hypothetical protein
MKPECYTADNTLPSCIPCPMPQVIHIETPGHYGTGYLNLPIGELVRGQWLGRNIAETLVLEGAAQVMGAVLASDRHDPAAPADISRLLREFEDVEFKSPVNPSREVRIAVRIHIRRGTVSRGIFVASQGAALIAAGKLALIGKRSP